MNVVDFCRCELGQTLWVFAIVGAMVAMASDARASGAALREAVAAMHSKPDLKRGGELYDAVDGRRPDFSAPHIRLLARLDRDDIAGVADYISRLPLDDDGDTTSGRQ